MFELKESPITLPEDANYADLNKAHNEGKDSMGRTESELYPDAQAEQDAATTYTKEVSAANEFYPLRVAKEHVSTEKRVADPALTQEIEAAMAAKLEELQQRAFERVIDMIKNGDKGQAVPGSKLIEFTDYSAKVEWITKDQQQKLLEMIQEREEAILQKFVDGGLEAAYALKTFNWSVDMRLLTREQADRLTEAVQLREFRKYKKFIEDGVSLELITSWINSARSERRISEAQHQELLEKATPPARML